jgi:hypothetical protein
MATTRTRRRTPKKDWRPAFLQAFAETGLVIEAAKKAKVARSTVYEERDRNQDFAKAWAAVEEWTTEEMEQEARRRAVLGVEEPVYHQGKLIDHVRRYSDTLLIFLLKARRPEVYRENHRVEHTGPDGGPIQTQELIPSDAEWHHQVAEVLEEAEAITRSS